MRPRIVRAALIGRLPRLQGLAERIFGTGNRPDGWFLRKLRRECVDPELSVVALRTDLGHEPDPTDPDAWCGYALAGAPGSLPWVVRTAGTGVIPEQRGCGIGSLLLRRLCATAKGRHMRSIRVPATPDARGFYERHGFTATGEEVTMLAFARRQGPAAPAYAHPPRPWTPAVVAIGRTHVELSGWLAEAWSGTEQALRLTMRVPIAEAPSGNPGWVHLSREGSAMLAQRVLVPRELADTDAGATLIDGILDRLPQPTPVLVGGLDSVSSVTSDLMGRGWDVVQSAVIVERSLTGTSFH